MKQVQCTEIEFTMKIRLRGDNRNISFKDLTKKIISRDYCNDVNSGEIVGTKLAVDVCRTQILTEREAKKNFMRVLIEKSIKSAKFFRYDRIDIAYSQLSCVSLDYAGRKVLQSSLERLCYSAIFGVKDTEGRRHNRHRRFHLVWVEDSAKLLIATYGRVMRCGFEFEEDREGCTLIDLHDPNAHERMTSFIKDHFKRS